MIDIKRQEEAFEKACINKQYIKLGNCAKFSKGKNVSKSDIVENGKYPAIRYGELYTKYEENITNVVSTVDSDENLIKSKIGDILVPSSGETAIDLATASCILLDNVIIGGDINIIDVDRKQIDPVYLSYYINSKLKYNVAKLAQGISVIHIYNSELKGLQLSIPELYIQNKATNFLTSLDSLIQKQEEYIEELKLQKKGYSQKLFSQKLRFDGFDEKWEIIELKDISNVVGGYPFKSEELKIKGKFPIIKIGDIKNNIKVKEHNGSFTDIEPNAKYMVENNVSVIALSGATFGKVGIVRGFEKIFLNQRTAKVIATKGNQNFINAMLKSNRFKEYIDSIPSQSAQPNISNNDIEKYKMCVPYFDEQKKIGNILSVFDSKIELQEKKLEQLKLKKKYYLNTIFA